MVDKNTSIRTDVIVEDTKMGNSITAYVLTLGSVHLGRHKVPAAGSRSARIAWCKEIEKSGSFFLDDKQRGPVWRTRRIVDQLGAWQKGPPTGTQPYCSSTEPPLKTRALNLKSVSASVLSCLVAFQGATGRHGTERLAGLSMDPR